ncbi:WD repeat-containing protein PCN isoform X2 [Physcomitrium patens]|uniref:WD repeat-containing protein PCN isoform X2 n=1 Tax=Physcomitrium patens TaxID=3218 RepID=UPI000D15F1CA|nr:WD repeat-containing protein PCN-like isoform X2 [Physcomitrium patens]|eukprot:XP_024356552.1 WD repeat-containing protein PCN-like isoform X2 [Physcomitrella patens]
MVLPVDYTRETRFSYFVSGMVPVSRGRFITSRQAVMESMGGSIWQLAAEHMDTIVSRSLKGSSNSSVRETEGNDSDDEGSSSSSDSDDESDNRPQRVALACEDGVVRIFEVATAQHGLVYRKSFPRVIGRILSVAWTWDGGRLVAGGSDGCIRCWDIANTREIYRITAGVGGKRSDADLCIWSLLVLRNGDIVSGDSSGSTQFWDGHLGTLLQAQTRHDADVLALATCGDNVFAAGADGRVVQFRRVAESQRLDASTSDAIDVARGGSGEKWIYVGSKRTHTHDVKALTIATPILSRVTFGDKSGAKMDKSMKEKTKRRRTKENPNSGPNDHRKWARAQTAMLISGGNDAKLFTYPANGFLSFYPHDVCPCPERPFIQLVQQSAINGDILLMAQHPNRVDIWKFHSKASTAMESANRNYYGNGHSVLGKRKWEGESYSGTAGRELMSNGNSNSVSKAFVPHSNGHASTQNGQRKPLPDRFGNSPGQSYGKAPGTPPALLATIKINSSENIVCSTISGSGDLVAFADSQRPRLYVLERKGTSDLFQIKRKKLPSILQTVNCMIFSADSSRLIMTGPRGVIWVVDPKSAELVHTFHVPTHKNDRWANGLVKVMCASPDGQWLAAASSTGQIAVFNFEVLRHQWTVPVLDGTPATAMVFHPGSNNVLFVSSAANQIHALDVEARAPGQWSRHNGARVAKKLQDFPGTIIGLSLPSYPKSTSIIAYSSSAMCHIDLSQPIGEEAAPLVEKMTENGSDAVDNRKGHAGVNGNGNGNGVLAGVNYSSNNGESKSLVVVNLKNPVLFLGHTGRNSVLIVERPWIEVLRQFPAPVSRHIYGN